jgi:hypothetical protein
VLVVSKAASGAANASTVSSYALQDDGRVPAVPSGASGRINLFSIDPCSGALKPLAQAIGLPAGAAGLV